MPYIKLNDDLYNKVKQLAEEIANQDNRGTSKPYFFQIRQSKEVVGVESDYTDKYKVINEDCKELCEDTELPSFLAEYIIEGYVEETNPIVALIPAGATKDEITTMFISMGYVELQELVIEHLGWDIVGYKLIETYENAFLTEKSIKKHLKLNRHHYTKNAYDYLQYSFRNPDLKLIFELLEEINKCANEE